MQTWVNYLAFVGFRDLHASFLRQCFDEWKVSTMIYMDKAFQSGLYKQKGCVTLSQYKKPTMILD